MGAPGDRRDAPNPNSALTVCEHLFVSLSALHHAIRAKDADRALKVAGKLRRVPLRYAARLTVLLADMKHPRYETAARHFIVAFTEELEPPTMQVKKVADALAHVHHHYYGAFRPPRPARPDRAAARTRALG